MGKLEINRVKKRVVAPLVSEASLYDWDQPTAKNLATEIVVRQIKGNSFKSLTSATFAAK